MLIFNLLGPAPGVSKIFVRQFFSKKIFFENIFAFLTPLQSEIENFELTSSFAFFLKISELFSKPENSNYSRRGDPKRMCACHIYDPKFTFNVVFDPLAVKIQHFWMNLQCGIFSQDFRTVFKTRKFQLQPKWQPKTYVQKE